MEQEKRKSDISKSVGKKILELRLKKGFTRDQLAEMCNLSSNYIYELEKGTYSLGSVPMIDLCNALDTTPTILLSEFLLNKKSVLVESISEQIHKLNDKEVKILLTLLEMLSNDNITE